jgi:ribosomal protein S18 acetylase RimI-like enzyme
LRAGTQSANTASLSLYEKLGFRIASTSYVLHHHGSAN